MPARPPRPPDPSRSVTPPRPAHTGRIDSHARCSILFPASHANNISKPAGIISTGPAKIRRIAVKAIVLALSLSLLFSLGVSAQQSSRTEPVEAIRDNGTGFHALVGARAVTAPGRTLDNATIVIRNGLIQSVQAGGAPPAGARVWDLKGQTVYAGFIDAHADLGR